MFLHHWIALHCIAVEHCIGRFWASWCDFAARNQFLPATFCEHRRLHITIMMMMVIMRDGNYDDDVGDDDCNVLRAPEVVQQIKEHCKKFVTKMINLLQPQCRSEVFEICSWKKSHLVLIVLQCVCYVSSQFVWFWHFLLFLTVFCTDLTAAALIDSDKVAAAIIEAE